MRYVKPIRNMLLPSLLFYAAYKITGLFPALIISLVLNALILFGRYLKEHYIANTQIIGILGGVFSAITVGAGGNEKWTFVPALAQNVIMAIFFAALTAKKKSVVHYLAKDFRVRGLENRKEERLMPVNIIWLVFFFLKIAVKAAGILFLEYDRLYWLVFLMGDPAFILVVILSAAIIRNAKE